MIPQQIFEQSIRRYFHVLTPYLDDESVSEIMVNGPNDIWIEVKGKLQKTDARFENEDDLMGGAKNIAQYVGKTLNELNPRMDARLPDGSRVHVVLPPCARNGVSMAIRRFGKFDLTIDKLISYGSINREAANFIDICVKMERNIIVAGGTGSGKTSLLNCVSSLISDKDRIIVIEDSSELQMQQPHCLMLETRGPDAKGRGAVEIEHLFHSAMRLRPDRIVIGEIRGGEALTLLQAMTSGHGGTMSTTHATYPDDTLRRLETMAMMSEVDMPLAALRSQVASAIQVIIQTSRFNDGSRKITHICEVLGLDERGEYRIRPIFVFRNRGNDPTTGKVIGEHIGQGNIPTFIDAVRERGLNVDERWFAKPRD
ncbi:CpaF family protein [Lujinxingia litoralis]|uniref:CpaF family protein n=1 Tax=Lujinxingia litoralis TaxID=2211119 RepID=A0A328CC98_9DELT|nr:ATPase, T2SS/T4P/T4SS family [Lujinxingia litoralis]RAL24801.1 CpaF family protein [Lujinxingia litoralis]